MVQTVLSIQKRQKRSTFTDVLDIPDGQLSPWYKRAF